MDFEKNKEYEDEARARWSGAAAFIEYEDKTKGATPEERRCAADGMMRLFVEIGKMKDLPPEDGAVRAKISELQKYITDNYYTCTDEIFRGLGEMYSSDARFRKNIDCAGGDGTAEFTSRAIRYYIENKS